MYIPYDPIPAANCERSRRVETVRLSGWIHRKRDRQSAVVDRRDPFGITQCVIDTSSPIFETVETPGWNRCSLSGPVVARSGQRPSTMRSPHRVVQIAGEGRSPDVLPCQVSVPTRIPAGYPLRYRYLDLRRRRSCRNIGAFGVISSIRRRMIGRLPGSSDPILTASSPEGARDILVPLACIGQVLRVAPGAPAVQAAARGRGLRQVLPDRAVLPGRTPAPTARRVSSTSSISEMAFATQDDVFNAIEPVIAGVFEEFAGFNRETPWPVTATPFPRIPYAESMLKYGNDKPDLRNLILIADVADVFAGSDFGIFAGLIEKGGTVRAIPHWRAERSRAAGSTSSTTGPAKRARRGWATSSSRTARARARLPSSSPGSASRR